MSREKDYIKDNDYIEVPPAAAKVTNEEIKKIVFTADFMRIFYSHFTVGIMMILVSTNYKKYGLSKVNNDYFITFVGSIALLGSSLTNLIWGYCLDYNNFKLMSILMCFLTGITTILFPILASLGEVGFGIGLLN